MNAIELRDNLLKIMIELKIPTEKFLKGELSYIETLSIQKEVGPWKKILDKFDNQKNNGILVKVFLFTKYNVALGSEIWYDFSNGPFWDSSWFHEYSEEILS